MANLKKKFAKAKAGVKKHIAHPKDFLNNAKDPAIKIGLATAGIVGAQKFLDFKELMKDKYAKDPDSIFFKHEGLIKVGAAIVTIAMWKTMPEWVKWLVIGIGIQGGIIAVRTYTKDAATGDSFIKQIGAEEYEKAINALADEIKSVAEQSRTGVGEGEDMHGMGEDMTGVGAYNEEKFNSQTGVGGMGMGMDLEMV